MEGRVERSLSLAADRRRDNMDQEKIPASTIPDMSGEDLGKMLYLAARDLNTLDGLWFLMVEEKYGTDVAVQIDELVWERFPGIEAKRVRKVFGIEEVGLKGFLETIRRCPSSAGFGSAQIEMESEGRAIMRVTNCLPQAARVQKGLGTFNCRGVDERFYRGLAKAVDPRVKVACVFCPPEERRNGVWCEWVFEMQEGNSHPARHDNPQG
ncbi:MAG: DUF6125 family protein [Chloroflexota bacterium]